MPEYNIYKHGTQVARVKKEFTFFKPKFMIESSFGNYTMQGDFLAYDFDIMKDDIIIASISKKFFALSDTYSVDIPDNEDQAFILSLVIVIDQVLHDSEHSSH